MYIYKVLQQKRVTSTFATIYLQKTVEPRYLELDGADKRLQYV